MESITKSIWKFPLAITDEQIIAMPEGAEVLSVQMQDGIPCMWALVDTEADTTNRTFIIHGTGHPCVCDASEFVGTFQMRAGTLVFHLFEKR